MSAIPTTPDLTLAAAAVRGALVGLTRRLRLMLLVRGVLIAASAWLGVVFLVGMLDALFRWSDPGVLVLGTTAVAGSLAWLIWRRVWPAIASPPGEVEVARLYESQAGEGGGNVTSTAAALVAVPGPLLRGLAAAAVFEAERRLAQRPPRRALALRPLAGPLLALAGMVGVFATTSVLAPQTTWIAMSRLASPYAPPVWPARCVLVEVDTPERIAEGGDWSVNIINRRGDLPDDLRVLIRSGGASANGEEEPATLALARSPNAGRATGEMRNVRDAFRYRIVGGDDRDQPWRKVTLVTPPRLTRLTVRVTPPPAVDAEPVEYESDPIVCWQNATITATGRFSRPVKEGRLVVQWRKDERADASRKDHPRYSEKAHYDLAVTDGGFGVAFPAASDDFLRVAASARYWLAMTDLQGFYFITPVRTIEARPDQPPRLLRVFPEDYAWATREGALPLTILAADDVRVSGATVTTEAGNAAGKSIPIGEMAWPLASSQAEEALANEQGWIGWIRRATAPAKADASAEGPGAFAREPAPGAAERFAVLSQRIPVKTLAAGVEDDTVEYRVSVRDSAGHPSPELQRRLALVTPGRFEEMLCQRLTALARDLVELAETAEVAAGRSRQIASKQPAAREPRRAITPVRNTDGGAAMLATRQAMNVAEGLREGLVTSDDSAAAKAAGIPLLTPLGPAASARWDRLADLTRSRIGSLAAGPLWQAESQLALAFSVAPAVSDDSGASRDRAEFASRHTAAAGHWESLAAGLREVAADLQAHVEAARLVAALQSLIEQQEQLLAPSGDPLSPSLPAEQQQLRLSLTDFVVGVSRLVAAERPGETEGGFAASPRASLAAAFSPCLEIVRGQAPEVSMTLAALELERAADRREAVFPNRAHMHQQAALEALEAMLAALADIASADAALGGFAPRDGGEANGGSPNGNAGDPANGNDVSQPSHAANGSAARNGETPGAHNGQADVNPANGNTGSADAENGDRPRENDPAASAPGDATNPDGGHRSGEAPNEGTTPEARGEGGGSIPSPARQKELMLGAWKYLPPKMQQRVAAPPAAEFLPEYAEAISEYYQRLASGGARR